MATLRDVRRRIKSVKNIEQITNAMQMVAAARLRRAQEAAVSSRPYAEQMQQVISTLAAAAQSVEHPLLEVRPERRIAVVVIGGERGLCGSYNVSISRKLNEFLSGRVMSSVSLTVFGKRLAGLVRRSGLAIETFQSLPDRQAGFADIRSVAVSLRGLFESCQVDAVYLLYARFISPMHQRPTVTRLLPVEQTVREEEAPAEYIFEPPPDRLLGSLLPRYVDTLLYRALVEAVASEHGARMTAMAAATKNAGDMIETLTLQYNKARQAAITKELLDIVGTAEALR